MLLLSRPPCILVAPGRYHCADIRALYLWLASHGYHFSGRFGPVRCNFFTLGYDFFPVLSLTRATLPLPFLPPHAWRSRPRTRGRNRTER